MAADSNVIRAELKSKFGEDIDDELLAHSVDVCQTYNISGQDLFFKWEAENYNQLTSPYCMKHLHNLKATLRRRLVSEKLTKSNLSGRQSKNFAASPAKSGVKPGVVGLTATPVKSLARVQDGFDLSRVEKKVSSVAGPSRVSIVGPSMDEEARKKRAYRYMYEKVSERSGVLDDRIDYFGELVKACYDVEELGDPSAVTEEEVVVVGRITFDSEASSGNVKLNKASLVLESSRMMGAGARVPLRLDDDVKVRKGKRGIGGQGFFPGAIVALKGKNGGGGSFFATEILSLPPLQPPSSTLIKSEHTETQFSMYIACGPFTSDADLQFRPFQGLVSKLKSTKPPVVLLVGPFIDATHTAIETGDVASTPTEIFQTEFLDRLREFLDSSPGSRVLLVPSTRDILSDHVVFPQCEFDRSICNDPRIHLLPNPTRFTVNGVHFAASSVDVLFHLRKEEYFQPATEIEPLPAPADPEGQISSDAMANLCRHILQQRSFYPIFPVPHDLAHEVNLDVTHSDLLHLVPQEGDAEDPDGSGSTDPSRELCAPDVLIVPSRLKHFSKVVDDTVAINPSRLQRSRYAVLDYAGHAAPGLARDRLKVELTNLEG